jgi:peptide/nickel transport system permease protein
MRRAGSAGAVLRFTGKRLLLAVPTLLGIALCGFVLLQLAPGDAADVLAGETSAATPEYLAQIKARFGPDQPLWVQFGHYLWQVLHLDHGYSSRGTVIVLIGERLPATLLLIVTALAITFLAAVTLGAIAGSCVNRWVDSAGIFLKLLAYLLSIFCIGLALVVMLSLQSGLFPSGGMESAGAHYTGLLRALDIAEHLAMPAALLAVFYTALNARRMRASMVEVLNQDHVTAARAKGLPASRVLWRHVLPNAVIPIVPLVGLQVGTLLAGSVVLETVFSWPGLGRLAFEAVRAHDLNLLLGVLLASSLIVFVVDVVADFARAWLDPRIELR